MLLADGDAHAAFAVGAIAQGNPAYPHGFKNYLLRVAKAAQNEVRLAAPTFKSQLLQLFPEPFTPGPDLGDVAAHEFAIRQRFPEALHGEGVYVERRNHPTKH